MLFNVPQYIDVEDKVAGPLTGKQLLWMIGMGAVLLVLWNIFQPGTFLVVSIPIVAIFVALAFYRPYNQPLITLFLHGILYLFRPKVYVWNRPITSSRQSVSHENAKPGPRAAKVLTNEEITRLAGIVDK